MAEDQTATVPPVVEPAPAATPTEAPKTDATDWRAAYVGIQRTIGKRDQRIEDILTQNQALVGAVETLKGDVDVLLKQSVGEEGLRERQTARQFATERQEALRGAETSKQYVAASIDVMASTMRAAGVSDQDIRQVFLTGGTINTLAEWSEYTKAATADAVARARAAADAQTKAKSQPEIEAEAKALAERTLRTRGIDKVDLGRGQSRTPERSFIERLRAIDRNTPEGEADFQRIRKDVARGTLQT